MAVRIGVDAGGTFTDVCLLGDDGEIIVYKTASTPDDPGRAIISGANTALLAAGISPHSVSYFGHGTTVATNTLLQGNGATTGVITTEGFRDLLEIARQERPDLYDLQIDKPPPLAHRRHRREVPERMRYDGSVETSLDVEAVRLAARELRAARVKAVAVCFLYSYLYPDHELQVAKILHEEWPEAYASLSHNVLAEFREYERLSTTVVNAYIGPVMAGYIEQLQGRLDEIDITVNPYITQSNGGLISLEVARDLPVRTVLSGPAAGVIGAVEVARVAGFENIITFDMGGTSTDVSLVEGGRTRIGTDMQVAGYPIKAPMIDINTVGAGGGSIAWIDSGGHLKVGPQSAGADPGPAGYGLGGTEATVTDANILLGTLGQRSLLGGRMSVDEHATVASVEALAREIELSNTEIAQGILSVVTMNMARAIRVISIERGFDPRDFAMIAFGGAGPLHASRLARELDIPKVIIPLHPGLLCALGLLVTDLRSDFSRTVVLPATETSLTAVNLALDSLEQEASAWLDQEGIAADARTIRRQVDMRYTGQNFELPVQLPESRLDRQSLSQIIEHFDTEHERSYGFAAPGEPVQFVTVRLEAYGHVPTAEHRQLPRATGIPDPTSFRKLYLPESGGWIDCPVYLRSSLLAAHQFDGPAIVEQMDSTTLVLPGQQVRVDLWGNLLISEQEHSSIV